MFYIISSAIVQPMGFREALENLSFQSIETDPAGREPPSFDRRFSGRFRYVVTPKAALMEQPVFYYQRPV
jgi:hypothetical protein